MHINSYKQFLFVLLVILAGCKKTDNGPVPVIVTSVVDVVTPVSAVCSGNITSEGGDPQERGVCWSTEPAPDITGSKTSGGTGVGQFSFLMTGLSPETMYYVRAYATNKAGTGYGEELTFTTPADHTGETGTITDADGNIYHTRGIGSQYWTVENLRTTKYNDSTDIPKEEDNGAWAGLASPAYCWYNNDENNKAVYGALYNWYAVISPKLAPQGWHVSTDAEWVVLETYAGGISVAGGKVKETGILHWKDPNAGATDEYGFTALPGGIRNNEGAFLQIGESGNYWTTSVASNLAALYYSLDYLAPEIARGNTTIKSGMSVRLVKD